MRKSELQKNLKSWQKATESHEEALCKLEFAGRCWHELPGDLERARAVLATAQSKHDAAFEVLTKPLSSYKTRRGYSRRQGNYQDYLSPKAQQAEKARNVLRWSQERIGRIEQSIANGCDTWMQESRDTFIESEGEIDVFGNALAQSAVLYCISNLKEAVLTEQEFAELTPAGEVLFRDEIVTLEHLAEVLCKPKPSKPTRSEPEGGPREVQARASGTGKPIALGKDVLAALKGLKVADTVQVCGCTVGVKGLSQWCRVMKNDELKFSENGGSEFSIETLDGKHRATIKNGAWDKARGESGHTARLEFVQV